MNCVWTPHRIVAKSSVYSVSLAGVLTREDRDRVYHELGFDTDDMALSDRVQVPPAPSPPLT